MSSSSTSLDLVAPSPALRIFLGAASEHDPALSALATELQPFARVDTWRTQRYPGVSVLEKLRRAATSADFGVFLWGKEDRTDSRGASEPSPRDNVVYEAGLFAGYLGSERTLVVMAPGIKAPSDYLGITSIEWTSIADVAAQIREVAERLGASPASRIAGAWWQFVTGGYQGSSVLAFVTITVRPDSRVIVMEGRSWDRQGVPVATWKCPAAALDEQTMTLRYTWEGPHTTEANLPMFFGTGEIGFDHEPFTGRFTSAASQSNRAAVNRLTRYMKADPGDAPVLNGTDVAAQRRLVAERLALQAALGPA